MRYRIALCGFSAFEYRAMHFSFQHPPDGETGYDVVDALLDADFAVVDADSSPAVKGVVLTGRVAKAVFVGAMAPPGATRRRAFPPACNIHRYAQGHAARAVPAHGRPAPAPRICRHARRSFIA